MKLSRHFSQTCWQANLPVYERILAHPFVQGLADGTLPRPAFATYAKQDALYLVDFAKALALVAARVPEAADTVAFLELAHGAIVAERELHAGFFRDWDLTIDEPHSPACLAYNSYLVATAATQPVEVAIAALLPCFWIYQEVGQHLLKQSVADNPYSPWLEQYAGDEYAAVVTQAITLTDRFADGATPAVRARMAQAFAVCARLEWQFWDSAWRLDAFDPPLPRV